MGWLLNKDLEDMLKEAVVAVLKGCGLKETSVLIAGSKAGTSRMRNRNTNLYFATFVSRGY
jgi:hypothetical protein